MGECIILPVSKRSAIAHLGDERMAYLMGVQLSLLTTTGAELELTRVTPVASWGGCRHRLELDPEADLTHGAVCNAHRSTLLFQHLDILLQLLEVLTLSSESNKKTCIS